MVVNGVSPNVSLYKYINQQYSLVQTINKASNVVASDLSDDKWLVLGENSSSSIFVYELNEEADVFVER